MTEGIGAHMNRRALTQIVLDEVARERTSQDQQWGEQNHHPFAWLAILAEEVGEANTAAMEACVWRPGDFPGTGKHTMHPLNHFREELIQVAAVAVSIVECIDRDKWHNQKEIPQI